MTLCPTPVVSILGSPFSSPSAHPSPLPRLIISPLPTPTPPHPLQFLLNGCAVLTFLESDRSRKCSFEQALAVGVVSAVGSSLCTMLCRRARNYPASNPRLAHAQPSPCACPTLALRMPNPRLAHAQPSPCACPSLLFSTPPAPPHARMYPPLKWLHASGAQSCCARAILWVLGGGPTTNTLATAGSRSCELHESTAYLGPPQRQGRRSSYLRSRCRHAAPKWRRRRCLARHLPRHRCARRRPRHAARGCLVCGSARSQRQSLPLRPLLALHR